VLSLDQRRVAYAIVSLVCLAWAVLGMGGLITAYATPIGMDGTGGFLLLLAMVGAGLVLVSLSALVAGFVMIRRVNAGRWRWRTLLVLIGATSAVSALVGVLLIPSSPAPGTLLVLQAVLLLGLAAVLRPVPVAGQ
jgi:hypothetical protein